MDKVREALEAISKLNDTPLRLVEQEGVCEVAIYGRPHPTDGGNYAALYRGYNREFARAVVACVNALASPEAASDTRREGLTSATAPQLDMQRALDLARSYLYGAMGHLGISVLTDEAVESVASRLHADFANSRPAEGK